MILFLLHFLILLEVRQVRWLQLSPVCLRLLSHHAVQKALQARLVPEVLWGRWGLRVQLLQIVLQVQQVLLARLVLQVQQVLVGLAHRLFQQVLRGRMGQTVQKVLEGRAVHLAQ